MSSKTTLKTYKRIDGKVGEQYLVKIPGNPTTGYSWQYKVQDQH